jgi:predicted Zn-ribbon and HTH transcriptional regulator
MVFAASNYPDGHPTGSVITALSVTCQSCEEVSEVTATYERDTNASFIEPMDCPECGAEFSEQALNESEPLDDVDWY